MNIRTGSHVKTPDLDRSLSRGHLGCAPSRPLVEQPGLGPIWLDYGFTAYWASRHSIDRRPPRARHLLYPLYPRLRSLTADPGQGPRNKRSPRPS